MVVGGRGDLKSGKTGGLLGNRVFAKVDGGDFVKASSRCRVVPPSLVGIPAVVVCTSTGKLLVVGCFCPKSTRVIAFTVVCRVVSALKLVLGVVARVVGFSTKVGGPWGELLTGLLWSELMVVVSSSSSSKRNLG